MYEIDIEKFRSAPRCKELRQFDARTYAEHKAAAKRGEHPNVTEMPCASPRSLTSPIRHRLRRNNRQPSIIALPRAQRRNRRNQR
jgi:hypothetical protein